MSANMQVVLKGLPERAQETADMLDQTFPGLITWRRFAIPGRDCAIRLEGASTAQNALLLRPPQLTNPAPAVGKRWKVSPAAGNTLPRPGQFCASLSKSFANVSEPVRDAAHRYCRAMRSSRTTVRSSRSLKLATNLMLSS